MNELKRYEAATDIIGIDFNYDIIPEHLFPYFSDYKVTDMDTTKYGYQLEDDINRLNKLKRRLKRSQSAYFN